MAKRKKKKRTRGNFFSKLQRRPAIRSVKSKIRKKKAELKRLSSEYKRKLKSEARKIK